MKVRLRELKPNPLRDFGIDPLDEETVERLRHSIREHGFWVGIVCRRQNGHVEIGAGHHRVEAAIREGLEEGEVTLLSDIDDRMMVRIYAEENATQRGASTSTARTGSGGHGTAAGGGGGLIGDGAARRLSGRPKKAGRCDSGNH